jgi:ABC-2 type transport system permease protein
MLGAYTLWRREIVRFLRQRSRVSGALLQPILFWLLLGGGLSASFQPPAAPPGTGYLAYLYPGILALVLLFTAIFATISTVEDRRAGFLQGVLVAPVSRTVIVIGQALGGTTLAVAQGLLFLLLAPLAGFTLSPARALAAIGVMIIVAFALTNLGLVIAWRMRSTQGFHAIMNLLLIPLWLLSGAFFPAAGVPAPLAWVMRLDPLTYGLAALRACLDPSASGLPPLWLSLGLAVAFALVACAAAVASARGADVAAGA